MEFGQPDWVFHQRVLEFIRAERKLTHEIDLSFEELVHKRITGDDHQARLQRIISTTEEALRATDKENERDARGAAALESDEVENGHPV